MRCAHKPAQRGSVMPSAAKIRLVSNDSEEYIAEFQAIQEACARIEAETQADFSAQARARAEAHARAIAEERARTEAELTALNEARCQDDARLVPGKLSKQPSGGMKKSYCLLRRPPNSALQRKSRLLTQNRRNCKPSRPHIRPHASAFSLRNKQGKLPRVSMRKSKCC